MLVSAKGEGAIRPGCDSARFFQRLHHILSEVAEAKELDGQTQTRFAHLLGRGPERPAALTIRSCGFSRNDHG